PRGANEPSTDPSHAPRNEPSNDPSGASGENSEVGGENLPDDSAASAESMTPFSISDTAVPVAANPAPNTNEPNIGDLMQNSDDSKDGLVLRLVESKPHVVQGDVIYYELTLTNTATEALRELALLAAFPRDNMEIQKDEIRGPADAFADVPNGVVQYKSLPPIAAGETVRVRIPVKTILPGVVEARIQIFKSGAPWREKTCETRIFPAQ
ncbi:MAG: hypothetical protein Q4D38_05045, partial [Planctomycetia bacterium]|nr:hypothetical protein [Planctomycetia bacterium]